MPFLVDEACPRAAVAALRASGYDVAEAGVPRRGAADAEVLARAAREGRIVLTFDEDFAARVRALPPHGLAGIILYRRPMPGPAEAGRVIADLVAERVDWAGHFAVVEPGRVRLRFIP